MFPLFLKYLYTGQIRISVESAMPLLSLADKYNIKDLVTLCVSFMMKSFALAGQNGFLIGWLQYTAGFKEHQQLTNELKNFLRLNIEIVGYSRDFITIDPNNLVTLLQQNDLVVKSEVVLFDIVERWVMQKREQIEAEESLTDEEKQSDMKTLIEGVCTHIRYPMMSISELATIPFRPITTFSKEFFYDRVALGMSFHANQPFANSDPDISFQYMPRLYTSDHFCLEMKVDEIHSVENYKTFCACFFSLMELDNSSETLEENNVQWEIDFYPRGIRYNKAQLINVYHMPMNPQQGPVEVPETIMRTVRVKCTCKSTFYDEKRFKVR